MQRTQEASLGVAQRRMRGGECSSNHLGEGLLRTMQVRCGGRTRVVLLARAAARASPMNSGPPDTCLIAAELLHAPIHFELADIEFAPFTACHCRCPPLSNCSQSTLGRCQPPAGMSARARSRLRPACSWEPSPQGEGNFGALMSFNAIGFSDIPR